MKAAFSLSSSTVGEKPPGSVSGPRSQHAGPSVQSGTEPVGAVQYLERVAQLLGGLDVEGER